MKLIDRGPADRGSKRDAKPRSNKLTVIASAALAVVALLVVPAVASAKSYTLYGSGSSAAQPYMEVLFAKYHKLHKNITFKYNPDGGNQGQADVASGRSAFAIQTNLKLVANTAEAPLLQDALCIDVNKTNALSEASFATLRSIYSGGTLAWSGVPGSNLGAATIAPQGRTSSAGQYSFFTAAVMNGESYASDVTAEAQDGQVATQVGSLPDAIGYVGLANSKRSNEKALEISSSGKTGTFYACDAANVKSQKYPLWRYDYGVVNYSHPNAQVLQFFNWVTDTRTAQALINHAGAVATPLHRFGQKFS